VQDFFFIFFPKTFFFFFWGWRKSPKIAMLETCQPPQDRPCTCSMAPARAHPSAPALAELAGAGLIRSFCITIIATYRSIGLVLNSSPYLHCFIILMHF
jgi:hypothetical protein